MMFSAYDPQNSQYFETGRNSESKKECESAIITFLTMHKTLNGENWDIPDKTIIDMFEVRIDEHDGAV